MQRCVLIASLMFLVGTVSPALAEEWWVSQDPTTKHCKVVEKMPDGSTKVMIGASSYPTKDEAKAAKKDAQLAGVCIQENS